MSEEVKQTHIGFTINHQRNLCGYAVINCVEGVLDIIENGVVHLERLGDTPLDVLYWLQGAYAPSAVYMASRDRRALLEESRRSYFRCLSINLVDISELDAYFAGVSALEAGYPVLAKVLDLDFEEAFRYYDSVRAVSLAFAGETKN